MLRLPLADFDIDVAQSPFLPRVPRATRCADDDGDDDDDENEDGGCHN